MIEESPVFKEFKSAHPEAYLVHHFTMRKAGGLDEQVGYFDPETKQITTFSKEPVQLLGSDKSFSENEEIKPLNMKEVTVTFEDALKAAQEIMNEHYSAQNVTQEICILQHLDTQMWNMTLITNAFNMINIRIDAANGEVLSHEQRSIMDLGQQA